MSRSTVRVDTSSSRASAVAVSRSCRRSNKHQRDQPVGAHGGTLAKYTTKDVVISCKAPSRKEPRRIEWSRCGDGTNRSQPRAVVAGDGVQPGRAGLRAQPDPLLLRA